MERKLLDITNIDFAVLSRIQELGNRFGLKPYDFIATIDNTPDDHVLGLGVSFQIMTDAAKTDKEHDAITTKANAMLKTIGVGEGELLAGGGQAVIDALDAALQKAPKALRR